MKMPEQSIKETYMEREAYHEPETEPEPYERKYTQRNATAKKRRTI